MMRGTKIGTEYLSKETPHSSPTGDRIATPFLALVVPALTSAVGRSGER